MCAESGHILPRAYERPTNPQVRPATEQSLKLDSVCGRFQLHSLTSQNRIANNTPDSFGRSSALAGVQDTPAGDLFCRESRGNIRGAPAAIQAGHCRFFLTSHLNHAKCW